MSERYEVVQTLIRGKQSVKKTIDKKGREKVTHHKLPIGYVLKDLQTGETIGISHLEAAEFATRYGITNAQVVVSTSQQNGQIIETPYIKCAAGFPPLQDPMYVIDVDRYMLEHKGQIKISKSLAEALSKTARSKSTGKTSKPRYTREELLKIIEKRKAELDK